MRLIAVLAVALLLWAPTAWAQPGPNPYLAQARVFYQGLPPALQRSEIQQRITRARLAHRASEASRFSSKEAPQDAWAFGRACLVA